MSDWLERAEKHQKYKEKWSLKTSSKIRENKEKVRNNYEKNKNFYNNFIENLTGLSERVNNLPSKYREGFGKIAHKHKESKLETHFNYYTSTKRQKKRRFKNILSIFKFSHQKIIRIVYFNVSKNIDLVEIEIKEVSMFRERLERKDLDKGKKKEIKTKSDKEAKSDLEKRNFKIKLLFQYEMEKLNKDFAIEFIDWLAFKKETEQLPIPPDRIKHLSDHKKHN